MLWGYLRKITNHRGACLYLQNLPAVELARASYSRRGQTITHTFAGVLLLLLATPLYDAYRLYRASKKTDKEHFDPQIRSVPSGVLVCSTLFCAVWWAAGRSWACPHRRY